jgi:hypothetical protein
MATADEVMFSSSPPALKLWSLAAASNVTNEFIGGKFRFIF